MREFFWRRRNARLLSRLNTVVETSERVRKSYRPKTPRVVIDTSFIERARADDSMPDPADYQAREASQDDFYGDAEADVFHQRQTSLDDKGPDNKGHDGDEYGGQEEGANGEPGGNSDLHHGEDPEGAEFDLLEEAVAQLELADRREAELREREAAALDEAQSLRGLIDELERKLAGEQKARADAGHELATLRQASKRLEQSDRADNGEHQRDEGLHQKLKSQQERVARLEVMVQQEQASRAAAEKIAVEARQQAGELQSIVDQLTHAKARDGEARKREEKAASEAGELRQQVAKLVAANADAQAERRDAMTRCIKAEQAVMAAESRLADAEKAASQSEEIARREDEARQDRDQALKDLAQAEQHASELEARVAHLESELGELSDALAASDSERQRLDLALDEAGEKAAAAAKLTKNLEASERDLAKARRHENELSQQLMLAEKRAETAEAEASEEKAARREATMRLEQAEMAAADAARELTEVRIAAESQAAKKPARDEATGGSGELTQRIAELEIELVEARHREGEAVRQLGVVTKRGVQFEEAVSAEQEARQAAEERMELAERAAEEAAEELSTFKAAAARREAELLAMIEKGRTPDVAAPEGGAEVAHAKSSAASYEPPSKVPSVMRGAFGAVQQLAPTPSPAAAQPSGSDEFLPPAKLTQTEKGKPARRDQRVASRMPVTLWRQGMSQAVSCTLLDKSASGARVELPQAKFGESMSAVGIGDKLTLTFTTAQERASVSCQIMWMDGRQCGLKYCGPFHTEVIKSRKPAPRGKSMLAR